MSRDLGSDKRVHILVNLLCALIHQLFTVPGGRMCKYQLNMKIAVSTETCLNLFFWRNVTSFYAHWKTDIRVDQLVQ